MPKRLRLRKKQRGRYEVRIDGTSVGDVRGNRGDWWALPVHPVVSNTYLVAAFPHVPNRYGLWTDPDRIAPLASRTDAVAVLCDIQGIPQSIALDLLAGKPMSTAQDDWITRALRGFTGVEVYESFTAAWRDRHPSGGEGR